MSRFRPIQPAQMIGTGDQDDEPPSAPSPTAYRPTKRRVVAQACQSCRKAKQRCNGGRPECTPCRLKGKTCSYDFESEEGVTRSVAMRARLEQLQQLVDTMRGADAGPTPVAEASEPAGIRDQLPEEPAEAEREGGHTRPRSIEAAEGRSRQAGREQVSSTPLRPLVVFRVPDRATTTRALDGFFSCSGKLFHVFSREQVAAFYDAVFTDGDEAAIQSGPVVCCLLAVAAIGAQYVQGTQGALSSGVEEAFYDIARHNLEALLVENPLDAIKVCTLLCMYNVMNKAIVSLAYVETGLGLCRRFGIHIGYNRSIRISNEKWIDYKKSWRTLMFLSSWLSSTLGYVSADDLLPDRIALSELDVEGSSDIADVVQTEMAKITLLKSQILRMHLAFKEVAAPTVRSIMLELQNWYDQLPDAMQLHSASEADLPVEVARSIFYVHLLYLGAIMLVYRRVVTQYIQSLANHGDHNILANPLDAIVSAVSNDGVTAAATSARILRYLLESSGIFKRCWLIIFQTYTSCVILVHSMAHKQINKLPRSTWKDEKENVAACLEVLAYCGSADRVSELFRSKLGGIYDNLCAHEIGEHLDVSPAVIAGSATCSSSSTPTPLRSERADPEEPPRQNTVRPFDIPTDADPTDKDLLSSLLMMLCCPFGDLDARESAQDNVKGKTWQEDPTRYEYPQLMERLDWDFESSLSFQWDFEKMGLKAGVDRAEGSSRDGSRQGEGNRFLGSVSPSGWTPNSQVLKK